MWRIKHHVHNVQKNKYVYLDIVVCVLFMYLYTERFRNTLNITFVLEFVYELSVTPCITLGVGNCYIILVIDNYKRFIYALDSYKLNFSLLEVIISVNIDSYKTGVVIRKNERFN